MCGIAGFWARGPMGEDVLRARLAAMTAALAHRGPDDSGLYLDGESRVGLGHRRLSIVDLSPEGHQPMRSASGRYELVYNGEIYNVVELRRAIAKTAEGLPPFRGHSDTELLLAAIERFGLEGAVARAAGMFALALWDRETRTLSLARDRLGKKPLVYARTATGFVFASELHALRRWPELDREVSRDALASYLRFGHVPSPHAIYASATKVEPGTIVTLDAHDAAPRASTYWDPVERALRAQANPLPGDFEDAADAVEDVLRRAIAERMSADVPVGAFLSGGIDSSLVVALMQAQSSRPVHTYSVGYAERAYDESAHAAAVAKHLGTEHHALRVDAAEVLAVVPELARIYDEPFADSSQVPTFLVSRFARRDVGVVLTGDGGDEVFGGYNRHLTAPFVLRAAGLAPAAVRAALASAIRDVPPVRWDRALTAGGRLAGPVRLPGQKAHKLAAVLDAGTSVEALYDRLRAQWERPEDVVRGVTRRLGPSRRSPASLPARERIMLDDLLTYLPDDILVKVDRATMAVSLEARAPLLDHRLVELAFRLPAGAKVRGVETKRVLRAVLHRHVPRKLVDRPKMGFGVPVGEWIRGPLRTWACDLLSPSRLRPAGFFDVESVTRRLRAHLRGEVDASAELWCVLMFEAWRDREREGGPGAA